jgi:hypothetical protein
MDTPSIRRVNDWPFLILPEPWTLQRIDSSEDWEEKKDAEKRARYAPVLEFFNTSQERQGWTMVQFNFTVGVRGTSRVNLAIICKAVAKRTFEAHNLMLCSYYAVKFSSSSQVDFSSIVGSSFALQHCIRLLS